MKEAIGDALASRGIPLILWYGVYVPLHYAIRSSLLHLLASTEVGAIADVIPGKILFALVTASQLTIGEANPGMDWRYFSVTRWVRSTAVEVDDGKFELVILVRLWACLTINS